MVNSKKIIVTINLVFSSALLFQNLTSQIITPRVGVVILGGTHINRLGLMYQLIYHEYPLNIVQSGSICYNFKNLGPSIKGFELNMNGGLIYNWGSYFDQSQHVFSEISSLTDKKYAAGYIAGYYYNKIGTDQWLGKLLFRSKGMSFVFENDFLSFKGYEDKYRTASIALVYVHDRFAYTLKSELWTGKATDGTWIKDSWYPSKHGFKNLEDTKFGKYSHGILALGVKYSFNYFQVFNIEIGIDSEHIRHVLQNRFMHDIVLNEKLFGVKNPHYPMLQEDGSPYLFEDSTKVRPSKLFLQTGLNDGLFY